MAKITPKQKAFADKYIETGNAEESARHANYSARGNTTKLLRNTTIQKYIAERMKELEDEAIAKQDEILKYLTKVIRREEKEYTVVTVRSKEEKWVDVDGKGTLKKQTLDNEEAQIIPIPAKLSDANKAAELLLKRYAFSPMDEARAEKTKAEIEFIKERTKLIKGTVKDTSLLDELTRVVNENE